MKKYDKQKLYFLLMDTVFLEVITKLRKKWKIPLKGFLTVKASKKWEQPLIKSSKSDLFNKDFNQILDKFKLSGYYADKIYEYLIFGAMDMFPEIEKNKLKLTWIPDELHKGKERVFIEVLSGTTIKDIQKAWIYVKQIQKSTFGYRDGRQRGKDFFNRSKYIYDLYESGKSNKEIREIIKEMPGCKRIYTEDISKIIAKIKKKIKEG